jgi:hypothetical protein
MGELRFVEERITEVEHPVATGRDRQREVTRGVPWGRQQPQTGQDLHLPVGQFEAIGALQRVQPRPHHGDHSGGGLIGAPERPLGACHRVAGARERRHRLVTPEADRAADVVGVSVRGHHRSTSSTLTSCWRSAVCNRPAVGRTNSAARAPNPVSSSAVPAGVCTSRQFDADGSSRSACGGSRNHRSSRSSGAPGNISSQVAGYSPSLSGRQRRAPTLKEAIVKASCRSRYDHPARGSPAVSNTVGGPSLPSGVDARSLARRNRIAPPKAGHPASRHPGRVDPMMLSVRAWSLSSNVSTSSTRKDRSAILPWVSSWTAKQLGGRYTPIAACNAWRSSHRVPRTAYQTYRPSACTTRTESAGSASIVISRTSRSGSVRAPDRGSPAASAPRRRTRCPVSARTCARGAVVRAPSF